MVNLSLDIISQVFEYLVRFFFFAFAGTASRTLLRLLITIRTFTKSLATAICTIAVILSVTIGSLSSLDLLNFKETSKDSDLRKEWIARVIEDGQVS